MSHRIGHRPHGTLPVIRNLWDCVEHRQELGVVIVTGRPAVLVEKQRAAFVRVLLVVQ